VRRVIWLTMHSDTTTGLSYIMVSYWQPTTIVLGHSVALVNDLDPLVVSATLVFANDLDTS
jgi:hypothetical protein